MTWFLILKVIQSMLGPTLLTYLHALLAAC